MQRTQHLVELAGAEQRRDNDGVPVRFAEFHPADNAQIRELVTTLLDAFQVLGDSQLRRGQQSFRRSERDEMLIGVRPLSRTAQGV